MHYPLTLLLKYTVGRWTWSLPVSCCFLFFSVKSWTLLNFNDSFGICISWGFQNTPRLLNLMKIWLKYWRLNATFNSTLTSIFGTGKFCYGLTYAWPSISQPNLHQIQQSGGVSESSGHADSKTVIEILDCPRFHGEKDQNIYNT